MPPIMSSTALDRLPVVAPEPILPPITAEGGLVRFGIHANFEASRAPALMGKATVRRGLLSISQGSRPRRQLLYEVRGGDLRSDAQVLLMIVDVTGGQMLSVGYSDSPPRMRLGQDSLTSVEVGFGWDEDSLMVDGALVSLAEACAASRLCAVLQGLRAEMFAALDIVTLTTLFGADEDSALQLSWPEGPRASFHNFATTVAVRWGLEAH